MPDALATGLDQTRPRHVVIAGGGTGGHLYPGIAVAHALRKRDPRTQVSFVGTARGIEARIVPQEGFPLDLIRSAGLKGKSAGAFARGVGLLPLSGLDAWQVLSRRKPDLVIGVGGYSSGPVVGLAARHPAPAARAECDPRSHQSLAGSPGRRRRRDLRVVPPVLPRPRVRVRQSGARGVPRDRTTAGHGG